MKIFKLILAFGVLTELSSSQRTSSIVEADNTLSGNQTFTGFISQRHAGRFDNRNYNQYFSQAIGGCDPQGLYTHLNGKYETAAHVACAKVPGDATQRQVDAIAGIVDNYAGAKSPAVGIFGGATCHSTNCRIFGANFPVTDNSFQSGNVNGIEIDVSLANSLSLGTGLALVNYSPVTTASTQAIQIATAGPNNPWPFGVRFATGATAATTGNSAAIRFDSVSLAPNHESQGIAFFANAPGGGQVMEKLRVLPNGALDVNATGGGGTFSVGGGMPISSTNHTGTGNLVLSNSPTLTSPTMSGIKNGTGLQLFNTSTTCTTEAFVGATCTTAAISLPISYSNTDYRLQCTGLGPTNVPVVQTVSKSSATFTITIVALTSAAATYSNFDCIAGHN